MAPLNHSVLSSCCTSLLLLLLLLRERKIIITNNLEKCVDLGTNRGENALLPKINLTSFHRGFVVAFTCVRVLCVVYVFSQIRC